MGNAIGDVKGVVALLSSLSGRHLLSQPAADGPNPRPFPVPGFLIPGLEWCVGKDDHWAIPGTQRTMAWLA